MKIIVQIPCYNEEETLPRTVAEIRGATAGLGGVELLVVDDGSTDGTVEAARRAGVEHIVHHRANKGLAWAFRTGIDACLRLGADVIVNTDADNQYCAEDIPLLVAPIAEGRADVVIGERSTGEIEHFSRTKKQLHRLGSFVVRSLSEVAVRDAVSGFRALSRHAALQMNIVSPFSYTIEMLIQAGKKQMAVATVPVRVNPKTRESRLFKSTREFIERSAATIVRIYTMYRPLQVFVVIGLALTAVGVAPIARFLYYYFTTGGAGHIQSLVLGGVLVVIGFVTFLIGLVADLISFNRQLIEILLEKVRRLELAAGPAPAAAPSGADAPGDGAPGREE